MNANKRMQKRTRRGFTTILALAGSLAIGTSAPAWAGFFDACTLGAGTIEVTQNTLVKNETATLLGDDFHDCFINVHDGVTLAFKNVRVTVTGDTRIAFDGEGASSLLIQGSTFQACDNDIFGFGGGVQISLSALKEPVGAGCDLMEIEPDGDLTVLSSTLRTDTEMLLVAPNAVTVQKSVLDATHGSFGYGDIAIGTFFFTTSQHTRVEKTGFLADHDITIGAVQDTTVEKNSFAAGGSITITGNPCTALSNSPQVSCQ